MCSSYFNTKHSWSEYPQVYIFMNIAIISYIYISLNE